MTYRMRQTCQELVGILPEEEWYEAYVVNGDANGDARTAVCDRKGQACERYPTQKFIDEAWDKEEEEEEAPRTLFTSMREPEKKKKRKRKRPMPKERAEDDEL
jgi:hypothetical protein